QTRLLSSKPETLYPPNQLGVLCKFSPPSCVGEKCGWAWARAQTPARPKPTRTLAMRPRGDVMWFSLLYVDPKVALNSLGPPPPRGSLENPITPHTKASAG